MQKDDKIFIAGGTGMVGSAIIRALKHKGYTNLIANYHSRPPQGDSLNSGDSILNSRFQQEVCPNCELVQELNKQK